MKVWLELYHLQVWRYPEPTNGTDVTYSWWIVWTQWTFWNSVVNETAKLNEKPVDPLNGVEYTYSVLNTKQEFELSWTMEWDLVSLNNSLNEVNADWTKDWIAYVAWNYNAQIAKISTWWLVYILALPSIVTSDLWTPTVEDMVNNNKLVFNWHKNLPASYTWTTYKLFWDPTLNLTNSLVVFSWATLPTTSTWITTLMTNLQSAFAWTDLANNLNYQNIINLDTNDSNAVSALWNELVNNKLWWSIVAASSEWWGWGGWWWGLIDQTTCESAWWLWVDSVNDVYIWTNKWNWFCISPRFWDWNADSNTWNWWISWNGWWNAASNYFYWWDATSVDDTWNSFQQYGQTKNLDSEVSYDCVTLWSATGDYDTIDSIVGRMKWLLTTWNDYDEAKSIDWITWLVPHTTWSKTQAIPALYIADCIDWTKDLLTDFTYTHIDDSTDEVTYAEYNTDVTISMNSWTLWDITYQNRQKYLTAWTQKSWSHLPSAMSYITTWYASASDSDWNNLIWDDRWEYQVACEASLLTDANDVTDSEWILASAIGGLTGGEWGRSIRYIWSSSCGSQQNSDSGQRSSSISSRFIVRP